MKIKTILSKLYISCAVLVFIFSVIIIYNQGFTSQELAAIKLHNKVAKLDKKDQLEKEQIRESKKSNGTEEHSDTPQWEDFRRCYSYDGEYSVNSDSKTCFLPEDFPDGSLAKGVAFDLGILIAEVVAMILLYAWIIWIFVP